MLIVEINLILEFYNEMLHQSHETISWNDTGMTQLWYNSLCHHTVAPVPAHQSLSSGLWSSGHIATSSDIMPPYFGHWHWQFQFRVRHCPSFISRSWIASKVANPFVMYDIIIRGDIDSDDVHIFADTNEEFKNNLSSFLTSRCYENMILKMNKYKYFL